MADVREILGLQAPKVSTGPVVPGTKTRDSGPPPMEPKKKKPRLSREVMSLKESLRHSMPSLVPSILNEIIEENARKFKAKIVLGTKRPSKWEKRPFKNPGRADGALFTHWVKARRLEEEYKFAKQNKALSIPKYTDEEYEAYFVSSKWSRQETDYLWTLCKQFDLRFLVIADRWNLPEVSDSMETDQLVDNVRSQAKCKFTVEEIKDRYYSIQRQLLTLRKGSSGDEDISQNPLILHPYDANREAGRKKQYEHQAKRTAEDLAVEAEMTAEWSRIDTTFRKHNEDAIKTLRLIKKQQKYYSNLKLERQAYNAAKEIDEGKRNKQRGGNSNQAADSSAAARASSASGMELDESTPVKLTRRHPAAYSRTHAKTYTATLIPLLNQQKYSNMFATAMPELGIETAPKHTFILASAMTELRCDLVLLHEMQRLHAEKQYEIEVLKGLHAALSARAGNKPATVGTEQMALGQDTTNISTPASSSAQSTSSAQPPTSESVQSATKPVEPSTTQISETMGTESKPTTTLNTDSMAVDAVETATQPTSDKMEM